MASLTNYIFGTGGDNLNGLVAYYRFDNNTTDLAQGNNATATDISYTTNSFGSSVAVFNGSTSKIDIPNQSYLSFGDGVSDKPFTMGMCLRKIGEASLLVYNKSNPTFTSGVGREMVFNVNSLERPTLFLYDGVSSSTYIGISTTDSVISINNDIVVFFTYDGSKTTGGLKMYIDGSLHTTNLTYPTSGTYNGMVESSTPPILGQHSGGTNVWDGHMSEFNLWNRELDATEVADLTTLIQTNQPLI